MWINYNVGCLAGEERNIKLIIKLMNIQAFTWTLHHIKEVEERAHSLYITIREI